MVLGSLLLLIGLGWSVWEQAKKPAPVVSDPGAVVAIGTSPVEPTVSSMLVPVAFSSPTSVPSNTVRFSEVSSHRPDLPRSRSIPTVIHSSPSPTPTRSILLQTTDLQTYPTRIVAPAIKLDAPVVPMDWKTVIRDGLQLSEWNVPKDAAGWHMNSALPGQGDNVVLSGHHNIEGKVFRHIKNLNPGDTIVLYVGSASYVYRVSEKYLLKESGMPLDVREKNARWMLPTGDERLTLITCWPYGWPGNSHRVVVIARPALHLPSLSEYRDK